MRTKELMKWLRFVAIWTIALIAFVVVCGESDTLPLLRFFALKVVGCAVLFLCAFFALRWHREGKFPKLWNDYVEGCTHDE